MAIICYIYSMDRNEIYESLMDGDRTKFIKILQEFRDTLDYTIGLMRSNNFDDPYWENVVYDNLTEIKKFSEVISEDTRGIGTLMKDLRI